MENELTGKPIFRNYKEFGDSDIVLTLRCLTEQKSLIKLEVQESERKLNLLHQELKDKKQELLLNTDFKAEGITNQAGREAFISKDIDVIILQNLIQEQEKNVQYSRNKYDMITDEQSNYKLLIRLEISRRQTAAETVLFEPRLPPEDLDKLLGEWDKMVKNEAEPAHLVNLEDLEKGAE